jgi:uncharacterized repeat protein (TIGR01451 family)
MLPKIELEFLELTPGDIEHRSVHPLCTAKGDFNADGIPDLIVGRSKDGVGELVLYPGNPFAIYPNEPGADRLRAAGHDPAAPFDLPSLELPIPFDPEFLETGDFDADGHLDILAAQAGGHSLVMLPGNGAGSFAPPCQLDLDGAITILAAGDIGRRDGLDDLVIGVRSNDGPSLIVLSSAGGAWGATPSTVELPDDASGLELGHLNGDGMMDVAVVAGGSLFLLDGKTGFQDRTSAVVEAVDLPFSVENVILGSFSGAVGTPSEIVVLDSEGFLRPLEWAPDTATWRAVDSSDNRHVGMITPSLGSSLVGISQAFGPAETVLTLDRFGESLGLVTIVESSDAKLRPDRPPASSLTIHGSNTPAVPPSGLTRVSLREPVRLRLPGKPVTVLPMRLTPDALDDLVILIEGDARPLILKTITQETVVVDSTTDISDGDTSSISALNANPGADGVIGLREAITAANSTPGLDTIHFDIPVDSDPGCDETAGTCTIRPDGAELPWVSSPVTIDGTTQPTFAGTPVIEIDGSIAGANAIGLAVWAGSSTIRGLVINRFADNSGLLLWTNGGDIVEGCSFGTDPSGTIARGGYNAVHVYGISNNTFGGTTAAARNLVSGGGMGVALNGGTTGTTIVGNFFGTDVAGTGPLGNTGNSILITGASPLNTVGGTETGAANVVAAGLDGATMVTVASESSGNVIRNNKIGTDLGGSIDLGGSGTALLIFEAADNTIGGSETAANVIVHNESGVYVVGNAASGNRITANAIFDHTGLGIDLCGEYSTDTQGGTTIIRCEDTTDVSPNDPGDGDSGANDLQNFPVLTSIERDTTSTTIGGVLDSTPDSVFTVDLYSGTTCNPSVHGEGEVWLGSTDVTTDVNGTVVFGVQVPTVVGAGHFVTATATDSAGSTSEFSRCLVEGVDLGIGMAVDPDPVQSGMTLVYTITVENFGLTDASGVTVTDNLPAEGTFVSSSAACTVDAGIATCTLDDVVPGGRLELTIEILVDAGAVGPLANSAVVSCDQEDPVPFNDSIDSLTVVNLFADGFESGDTSGWSSGG